MDVVEGGAGRDVSVSEPHNCRGSNARRDIMATGRDDQDITKGVLDQKKGK